MKHYLELYGLVMRSMGVPPEMVRSARWERIIAFWR